MKCSVKEVKLLVNEKALRETQSSSQTLHAGCSKAEPKIFAPLATADPLPVGKGWPKFNQLEMVTTFKDLQTEFGEDQCTQFRVIVVTDPQTHTNKPTDKTDYNTLRR